MIVPLRYWLQSAVVLLLAASAGQDSAPAQSGPERDPVLQEEVAPDPLPLRRVVIPVERVAAELQRARPGVLVQMPRADFEAKVLQAQAGLEATRTAPRLVSAFYAAELAGSTLVGGSGHWAVQHAGSAPGILSLPQFNLALSKVRVGAGEGVLAEFDGKNLGLAIDGPGNHEVLFDWTLRGQAQADGLAFQLRVPGCPISVLELKLPADHAVAVDRSAGILTGPLDAEKPGVKIWRLQSSGRNQVDLVVRKHHEPGGAQLLFASVESKQELKPSMVLADYEFRVEAVQGAAAELLFEGDGVLEPYEVTARGVELAGWDSQRQPGDAKTGPRRVVQVRLREPLRGTAAVRVRCWCARKPDQEWSSPHLRLRQAITRGETLLLDVPAPQQIERWDPGQFRLVEASADAEGGQKLRLVDRAPEPPDRQRPRFWALAAGAGLFVHERTRWSIAGAGMTLAAQLDCEQRRGQSYQLNLRVPAGAWIVEQVALEPAGALQGWSVAGPLLVLDLKRALTPRNPLKVSAQLRSAWQGGSPPEALPIPELTVAEAAARQASYEIHIDPEYQAVLAASSVPATLTDKAPGPVPAQPRFSFAYRDRALVGTLRLWSRRPALTAQVMQHVTLESGRAEFTAQLDVEPVSGHAGFIDLFFSGGRGLRLSAADSAGKTELRLERRAGVECTMPLLAFGGTGPWGVLATALAQPRGETWRLTLEEPLQQPMRVLLRGELQPSVAGPLGVIASCLRPDLGAAQALLGALQIGGRHVLPQLWDVPVLTVPDADHVHGTLVLHEQGQRSAVARPRALRELAPSVLTTGTQRFQHGAGAPWPELAVWTQQGPGDLPRKRPLDEVLVTHYAAGDGRSYHRVQIQVAAWPDADLPVRLPGRGWTVLAARLDGHWLNRLQQTATASGSEVRLPVPRDGEAHALDLLLASEHPASGWSPFMSVLGLDPEFPAAVLSKRHVWRLGPGLMPLRQETMRSWQRGSGAPLSWLAPLWHAADRWALGLTPLEGEAWIEPQRQALLSAEAAVRRRLPSESTLAAALERLLFDGLKEQSPLVLDREALEALGLRPQTGLSASLSAANRPFWEGLGLIVAPTPSAPVLTAAMSWAKPLSPEQLQGATKEAVLHGQDASGRFCRADFWLRHEPPADRVASHTWPPFLAAGLTEGWTEWEPTAGADIPPALAIVRTGHVRGLGVAGALGLFLLLIRAGRILRPPMALRFLILGTVAMGFAVVALPQALSELAFWPLLVVLAQLMWCWRRCLQKSGPRSLPSAPRAGVVAGTALLSALWLAARPAPAQPENADMLTVFYVDAGPDRQLALVRPELLKRLEELHQQGVAPLRGAFLTSASYAGKWQGKVARIDAQFELYSFAEKATLHVPLTQVELLEGAFLDGAPAFPSVARGKPGFTVPVSGRGFHRLTLAMIARPQLAGQYNEVRCGIPALPLARLSWEAPAAQRELQIVKAAGEESRAANALTQEVSGQLGREAMLHVRWRAGEVAPAAAIHEVREAYWWDLDDELPTLTALLRYAPSKANLGKIEIGLPELLEVHLVEVRAEGAVSPPGLARWQVLGKDAARRLVVDLVTPASAPLVLQVKAVPRFPLGFGQVSLRLPFPLAANPVEGFLAYRLEGAEAADKTRNLGVTALAPEVFAKAWTASGGAEALMPTRAYSFRRAARAASLELTLQPFRPQARLEWAWKIEPTRAELRGHAEFVGGTGLHCVEMELPALLKLTQVHAADLHHWSVHDDRLQIWFREGGKQRSVTLAGWLAKPLVKQRFVLPTLGPIGAEAAATVVRVAAAPGWTIAPETAKNLRRQPGEALTYGADGNYEGAFALRPLPANFDLETATSVEPRGDLLAVTVHLEGRVGQGKTPAFKVRLRDWPAAARLETSAPLVRQSHRRLGADQEWSLQFPSGTQHLSLQLRSYVPSGGTVTLPRLQVQGAQLHDQIIVLATEALRTVSTQGLDETRAALPGWDFDVEAIRKRGGSVWRATAPDWQAVVQATPPAAPAALRVLNAEQQAAWSDGRSWLHQIEYLLQVREALAVTLSLPPQAQLVATYVEDQPVELASAAGAALSIPLPQHADLIKVRLVWRYPADAESMLQPRLRSPVVLGAERSNVHGMLLVPPGVTIPQRDDFLAGDAQLLLGRLRAAVEASKADRREVSWLERGAVVRSLRRHLDYLARLRPAAQLGAQELQQQLQALTKDVRSGDLKAADASPSGVQGLGLTPYRLGLPYCWQHEGAAGPAVVLQARASAPHAEDWARELLTLTLVSLFLLSWLPGAMSWFRYAWPELLAGLTLIACVAWGWSAIGAALLFFAAAARLVGLARLLASSARSAPRSPSSIQPASPSS